MLESCRNLSTMVEFLAACGEAYSLEPKTLANLGWLMVREIERLQAALAKISKGVQLIPSTIQTIQSAIALLLGVPLS